ncbi:MAG: signal peptidase I [Clostridiaceae bacterium]|nr:signal peptidase I [Clostridiaceae bacterium]
MRTDKNTGSAVGKDKPARRNDMILELLDWVKYILIAVLIGLLLVVFVIQRNSVLGDSMLPNLHENDQLLVEKVSKWFHGIQYGDVITISSKDLPAHDEGPNIIKRVIGMPGDTVEIRDDGVYRNGSKLDEAYLPDGTITQVRNLMYSKVTLSENQYYVMGDNRGVSLDSRIFGPVPLESVIGKVMLRFYPWNQIGLP